ncbi:MAG TPA: PIG-L family deacetylase [Gammaproteobacteria bacterium]|nr:PIG-L family deacetylase [Gammaproteobacteria bacterium]
MINLQLENTSDEPLTILALGAHCDDIEIGCGGTMLSIINSNREVNITWVVFSSNEKRKAEAKAGARLFTRDIKTVDLKVYDFRDGFLPYHGERLKEVFEEIKTEINPDVIFTHYRQDLHQDHRVVSELTWNTFRNHFILEYEIPKWDGDLATPNTYVHLDEATALQKINFLQQAYNSQQTKVWFTDDLFWSIMRIRGMESNSPSRIAEAFYTRKNILLL